MNDVTHVPSAIEQGDPQAAEQLLPLVYDELRSWPRQKLAQEKPGQTLQATALVHEAYVRLRRRGRRSALGQRPSFLRGRRRGDAAHPGGQRPPQTELQTRRRLAARATPWMPKTSTASEPEMDLAALDAALHRLAEIDPHKGQARRAALLRRPDGRPGRRGPGHLPQQRRSAMGLRPGLAAPRAGLWRGGLTQPIPGIRPKNPGATGAIFSHRGLEAKSGPPARWLMNEEEVFHQALALSLPEERAAYLERACAGDPALRESIEALLRAERRGERFPGPACPGSRCRHRASRSWRVPERSSARTSCWNRSARGAWASSTWPSKRSPCAARSP